MKFTAYFDLKLRPGRERPIRHVQAATSGGKADIDQDCHIVGPIAEIGEQARIAHDDVEFIAVQHQVPLAVGRLMDRPFGDFDTAEMHAREIAQKFVMIAGDIDDARVPCGPCARASARRRCNPAASTSSASAASHQRYRRRGRSSSASWWRRKSMR